ncbi:uncharacterized [Tachysurus ichikawai]
MLCCPWQLSCYGDSTFATTSGGPETFKLVSTETIKLVSTEKNSRAAYSSNCVSNVASLDITVLPALRNQYALPRWA